MEMSQHQKIVALMIKRGAEQTQTWFYAPDFMKNGLDDFFVGYEAGARLSELAKLYPEMIESRRNGKYYERRFKFENIIAILNIKDFVMRNFVIEKFRQNKLPLYV